ncbi:putative ATP-dependent RNA helicase DHR1, partial [Massospora cicadina]
MSATLRVQDFVGNTALFPDAPPPVLTVEARQHPVTVHFNKRTPEHDYVGEAMKKIVKIHTRLPAGGILVFLTGQNEILDLCRRLHRRFPSQTALAKHAAIPAGVGLEVEDIDQSTDQVVDQPETEWDEDFGDSEEELDAGQEVLPLSEVATESPLYVLPLYAMLSTKQQLKVFETVPEGHRLCVVSTNVAETSLTIPNIRYVVDSGMAKQKSYDLQTQASSFYVGWTSQASADQRKGRAGRTGPGHCYRLYSSAVFNDKFEKFARPEISRTPIEGVVLQMKSMNIDRVANFPFPTPPPAHAIAKAERHLTYLGAVDDAGQITPVGKLMAMFPVAPRYAKMLAIGQQHGCMPYTIALVAALAVGDPFLKEYQIQSDADDDTHKKRQFYEALSKFTLRAHHSDLLRMLMAVGAYAYSGGQEEFCNAHYLRPKAMDEILKLRRQLTALVQLFCPTADVSLDPKLAPPTKEQALALRQILLAGFVDQVAILRTLVDKDSAKGYRPKGITGTPAYLTMWGEDPVYVHPTSALYLSDPPPPYVIYSQLSVTSSGVALMQGVTAIEPKWLISIAKPLVTFTKPLDAKSTRPRDRKDTLLFQPSYGPKSWPLPNHHVPISQLKNTDVPFGVTVGTRKLNFLDQAIDSFGPEVDLSLAQKSTP